MFGEGYMAGEREHEAERGIFWVANSPFGGPIVCG